MGLIDGNVVQHSHRQRKRLSEPPATVIIIGDLIGAFIDHQHAIGNRAANPAARLGRIKAARQPVKSVCAVGANQNRILVVCSGQITDRRIVQI